MTWAAPTVLTLETDSAWMVIMAVSLATLVCALLLRQLLARPGGLASSLLLVTPLVLPLVAGIVYQRGLLPEISVMRPLGLALMDHSQSLFHLLMVNDGNAIVPYAISGRAGPWILLIGLFVVSFMLFRRGAGMYMVRRLISRCRPAGDPRLLASVAEMSRRANLRCLPRVMMLPPGVTGVFAAGMRRGSILVSEDLLHVFDQEELDAIVAHEVAHLQSRDVPVVVVAGVFRDLVAWNPIAHIALRRLIHDREFEADRRAAALTGDPLAVASGLLKIVEIAKHRRTLQQRAVLAFWRPGYRISKRVSDLIAVADGRASVASMSKIPFMVAALIVALVGLQVAERIVDERSNAFAIVWGDPSPIEGEFYEVPKRLAKTNTVPPGATVSTRARNKRDLALPVRVLGKPLSPTVRVKPSDLQAWIDAVGQRIQGISSATVRWEARQNWLAEPIISQVGGSGIGIYRIQQQL